MQLNAEKKAIEIYNNYYNFCKTDVDAYHMGKFIICELINELKFNNGHPDRIRHWLLVYDFYIIKYKH
jgi:hypothetical protein